MKKLGPIFLLLCSCLVSVPAFSLSKKKLVGTWVWSSIGCRDTDLSTSSHQPIADNNQNPDLISEATFVFNSNDSASMDFVQDGEQVSLSGTYEIVSNGDVVNLIPRDAPNVKFKLNVVNNNTRLAVVNCQADYEKEREVPDVDQGEIDEKIRTLRRICGNNRCFVYLIGKV